MKKKAIAMAVAVSVMLVGTAGTAFAKKPGPAPSTCSKLDQRLETCNPQNGV